MKCIKCEREFTPKAIRCNGCGTVFVVNDDLKCPQCGKTLSGIYCADCTNEIYANQRKRKRDRICIVLTAALFFVIISANIIFQLSKNESNEEENSVYQESKNQEQETKNFNEIEAELSGTWTCSNGQSRSYWTFNNGTVTLDVSIFSTGQTFNNVGYYVIVDDEIRMGNATIPYSYENGKLRLYIDGIEANKLY